VSVHRSGTDRGRIQGRRWGWQALAGLAAALTGALTPTGAQASADQIAMGMFTRGAPERPAAIDAYARKSGSDPAIVASYRYWSDRAFVSEDLNTVDDRGAVPLVTWEPWRADGSGYSLRKIASGHFDRYVRRSARAAARWGRPILLRFAHEMNGDWVPWGLGVNGNTARDYVAAWRHLVTVFEQEGASNVRWVWSPNVDPDGNLPFERLYPGDRWVDWVALDGFNFAGGLGWRSFTDIFGSSYEAITRLSSKPLMIAEMGSDEEANRSKAEWITSMFDRELPRFREIRAIVWFNSPHGDRIDFRIDSSPESLAAYRSATASPAYRGGREELLEPEPVDPVEPGGIVAPAGDFGEPSLATRAREELGERKAWLAVGAGVLLLASSLALLALVRRRRAGR
jgi:hypothetical protein